jgi:hypothetical protein
MKYWKGILTIIVSLDLALALLPLSIAGANGTVTVSIDAPAEVEAGSDFIANVAVDYVENFNLCGFDVTYDETIITMTDVTGGEIDGHTVEVGPGDGYDWYYIPPGSPVDTGRIRVATGIVDVSGPGVNGTGYIARIHFHVLGSVCETSAIHLECVGMYDYQAYRIYTTTVDDSVHVGLAPLEITTTSLPEVKVGDYYEKTIEATGGQPPYNWGANGLPDGLSCTIAGVISGIPTVSGSFNVTINVTDSFTTPNTDQKILDLFVCIVGDANGDGFVDTGDITKVKRIYFELDDPTPCADVNDDGFIDTGDITAIKAIYFGA